jgi:hypothetical protein
MYMNDDVVNKSKLREILKEFIIDILIFPISSYRSQINF